MGKNKTTEIKVGARKVFRVLKNSKEIIDRLTLKQALVYLVAFSMLICFLLGLLLGVMLT